MGSDVLNANYDIMEDLFVTNAFSASRLYLNDNGMLPVEEDLKGETAHYPHSFHLSQNYPNPFNPSTAINYSIPGGERVQVQLFIYDLRGRVVRTLVDEEKRPGSYSVYWDGKDETGMEVGSGVYLYRIIAGSFSSTKKMLILR